MDVDSLISYYVNLLIYQYRSKPKARATIAILVKQLLADGLLRQVEDSFWLETAIGKQLDTIGKYVGLPRNIGPTADKDYFGCHDYVVGEPDNDNGFRDYMDSTVNDTGEWYNYTTSALLRTEVGDSVFIPMIRLKAMINTWDGTLAGAQYILDTFLRFSDAWYGSGQSENLVYNPDLAFGVDGWTSPAGDNSTGLPTSVLSQPNSWEEDNGTVGAQVMGTPASSTHWSLSGVDRPFVVTGGERLSFSAYVQQVGCSSVYLTVGFTDEFGSPIADPGGISATISDATVRLSLGDYSFLTSIITAPANAVHGWLRLTGTAAGGVLDPWVALTHADVQEVSALTDTSSSAIVDTSVSPANRCHSSPAISGTTGWGTTYNGTGLPVVLAAKVAPDGLRNWGTLRSTVTGTPAASAQWTVTTISHWFDVVPGQVIDVSAYVQSVGLGQISLEVVYNTSVGGYVGQDKVMAVGAPTDAASSVNLSDYRRLTGFSTVPAGSEKAFLQILSIAKGGVLNPWIGIAKPVIQLASPGQSEPGAWSPGLESPTTGVTWYVIEANLGLDPTTLIPYLPRKVGTSVRLTYSKPGDTASEHTYP